MLEISVRKNLDRFGLEAELACETSGIIALFGRSGAGKTTLVNLLAGLLRPDSGRIAINGTVLFDSARGVNLPPEKRRIGYVFQEGRLFPHLSVRANLCYGLKRQPAGERRIALEPIVTLLGLEALIDRRPARLSGGEKQRVALGRALLANPRLLLMDEPLAALDQPRKDEILPFIERLRDEFDTPIVYVSHAMQEIVRLADTLILMSEGRIIASGALEDLTSRLDLRPLTGRYEAGAVLEASLACHDPTGEISELAFPGGTLKVPHLDLAPGSGLRVRIRARDVALALSRPKDTSFLNILEGRIAEISEDDGPLADILIDLGGSSLWARITTLSQRQLGLRPGQTVYALVKAVAIDRHSLGRAAPRERFLGNNDPAA